MLMLPAPGSSTDPNESVQIHFYTFKLKHRCIQEFDAIYRKYTPMVPGNLPSQLEIMSMGQTYYQITRRCLQETPTPESWRQPLNCTYIKGAPESTSS